jgi:hypothetical protein
MGEDGVGGDAGVVYHADGGETAGLRGIWGELGGWDAFRGCSGGLGGVLRGPGTASCGPERGRAGGHSRCQRMR